VALSVDVSLNTYSNIRLLLIIFSTPECSLFYFSPITSQGIQIEQLLKGKYAAFVNHPDVLKTSLFDY
jgi:hypothetical protein